MQIKRQYISAIIPVYNVAPYLERCVNSLLRQTYKKLEIILIDDGSTDGCGQLCDKLHDRDSRIKVIHQINGGVSCARNAGLDASTGEYITFVDPDDWVEPNAYEVMLNALQQIDAQAVFCGFWEVPENSNSELIIEHSPAKSGSVAGKEALYQCMIGIGKGYFTSVWNKLFRRDAITGSNNLMIHFEKHLAIGEDEVWLTHILPNLNVVALMSAPLYSWFQHKSSTLHQPGVDKRWYSALEAKKECLQYLESTKNVDYPLVSLARGKIYNDLFHTIWVSYTVGNSTAMRYFRKELKEYRRPFYFDQEYSIAKKMRYLTLDFMVKVHFPQKIVLYLGSLTTKQIQLEMEMRKKKWKKNMRFL